MNSKSESLFPFLFLKNKETEIEIAKAISQGEGVEIEKIKEHLKYAYAKKNANLFLEAKNSIKAFWKEHSHLTLSDIKGLIALAMDDITADMIKKGDSFVELAKRARKG